MKSQKIGLFLAIIIQLNAMVGAGVVAIPSFMIQEAGPSGLLSCIFSIFIVLCMTISLGRLSSLHPGAGWSYRYPAIWGGHFLGMISSSAY